MDALLRASARKASARKAGKSAAKTRGVTGGRKLAWKGQGSLEEEIAGVERTLDFGASAAGGAGARATRGSTRLAPKEEGAAATAEPEPQAVANEANESVVEAVADAQVKDEIDAQPSAASDEVEGRVETTAPELEATTTATADADHGCTDMPDFDTAEVAEVSEAACPDARAAPPAASAASSAEASAAHVEQLPAESAHEQRDMHEHAGQVSAPPHAVSESDSQTAARKASTEHFREAVRLLQRAGLDAHTELFNLMEQVNDYALNDVFALDSDCMDDLAARLPAPVDGLDAAAAILVMVFGEEGARASPGNGRRASSAGAPSASPPLVDKQSGRVVFADVTDLFEEESASDPLAADSSALDEVCDGLAAMKTDCRAESTAIVPSDGTPSPLPVTHEAMVAADTPAAKEALLLAAQDVDDNESPAVLARTFFRNARERRRPVITESDDEGANDESEAVAANAKTCAEAIETAHAVGAEDACAHDSDAENIAPAEPTASIDESDEVRREGDCDSVVITRTQRKTQRSVDFLDDAVDLDRSERADEAGAVPAAATDAIERKARVAFADVLEEAAPEGHETSCDRVHRSPAHTESDPFKSAAADAPGSSTSDASITISEASHASEAVSEAASDASAESGTSEPKPRRLSFNSSPSGSDTVDAAEAGDFGDGGIAMDSPPIASPDGLAASAAATAPVSPPAAEDSDDDFVSCDSGQSDSDGSVHVVTARKDFLRSVRRSKSVVIGDSDSEDEGHAQVVVVDAGADSEDDDEEAIANDCEDDARATIEAVRFTSADADASDCEEEDSEMDDEETAEDRAFINDESEEEASESEGESEIEIESEGIASESDAESEAAATPIVAEVTPAPVSSTGRPRRSTRARNTPMPKVFLDVSSDEEDGDDQDACDDSAESDFDPDCVSADEASDSDFSVGEDGSADEDTGPGHPGRAGTRGGADIRTQHKPIKRKSATKATSKPDTARKRAAEAAADAAAAAIASIEIDSASDDEDIPGAITHVPASTYTRKPGGARAPRRPWPGKVAPSDDVFVLSGDAANAPVSKKPASKQPKEAMLAGRKFAAARSDLAARLFEEYNERVFGGSLPGDLSIEWNAHLKTTAGLTKYKRVGAGPAAVYTASVELSTKVIDDEGKLRRTLAHELCHAAAWLVDHVAKPPHGDTFRKWADAVTEVYPGIEVTTCHSYEIAYKYQYKCTGCAKIYGRHSKSIDLDKQGCGVCRARLELLGTRKADGSITPARAARPPSAYALFTKENFASVKASAPKGTPHAQIMKMLSAKWKEAKSEQNASGAQRSPLSARN